MYVLTDVYGDKVICNEEYNSLEDAQRDLDAEFFCFTCDDNDIEYGKHCFLYDNKKSAWARLNGNYRIWTIIAVSE